MLNRSGGLHDGLGRRGQEISLVRAVDAGKLQGGSLRSAAPATCAVADQVIAVDVARTAGGSGIVVPIGRGKLKVAAWIVPNGDAMRAARVRSNADAWAETTPSS